MAAIDCGMAAIDCGMAAIDCGMVISHHRQVPFGSLPISDKFPRVGGRRQCRDLCAGGFALPFT